MVINRSQTRYAGVALTVLLGMALALPAAAAEIWKVNVAKSKFGPSSNTLVLERDSGKATQAFDANGTPNAGKILVISSGRIYLAMDEATYNASGSGFRTVDYTNWRGMKLVQIGDKVRSTDLCGFHCQSGVPDPRMTLTFKTKGIDVSKQMNDVVVLNK